jgi:hypothetical protein
MERLLEDPDLRWSLGEAGYQLALNKHQIDDIARRYVDIFLKEARAEFAPERSLIMTNQDAGY